MSCDTSLKVRFNANIISSHIFELSSYFLSHLNTESNFVLGNAESLLGYPIVYCSDGFTKLTGYRRFEVIGNSCNCSFLYSMQTNYLAVEKIKEALKEEKDYKTIIEFSKKDGMLLFLTLMFIKSLFILPLFNTLTSKK